jgi:hypothetical protein
MHSPRQLAFNFDSASPAMWSDAQLAPVAVQQLQSQIGQRETLHDRWLSKLLTSDSRRRQLPISFRCFLLGVRLGWAWRTQESV